MRYRVIILSLTTRYKDFDDVREYIFTRDGSFIDQVRSMDKHAFAPLHPDYLYAMALLTEHEKYNILNDLDKNVFKPYEAAKFRVEFVELGFEFCKKFAEDKNKRELRKIDIASAYQSKQYAEDTQGR